MIFIALNKQHAAGNWISCSNYRAQVCKPKSNCLCSQVATSCSIVSEQFWSCICCNICELSNFLQAEKLPRTAYLHPDVCLELAQLPLAQSKNYWAYDYDRLQCLI